MVPLLAITSGRYRTAATLQQPKLHKCSHLAPPSLRQSLASGAQHGRVSRRSATASTSSLHTSHSGRAPRESSHDEGPCCSVLNILMGVGLLSVPLAFSKSGFAGVGILWLLGVVTNYTGKALCRCAATVSSALRKDAGSYVKYEEIALVAFGALGKALVSAIMYTELIGTCAVLLILESDNIWNLAAPQAAALASHGGVSGLAAEALASKERIFWLAAALVVPTVWAPDVQSLSFLGLCGFLATLTVTISVAYIFLTGDFTAGAATALVKWDTMPLIFGILAFCYAGHSIFPSIQASMRHPAAFPRVLDTAYVIVALLCTFLGVVGYYMYGAGALDVVTFNMNPGVLKGICASMILVNPLAKFALTMEPVAVNVRDRVGAALNVRQSYLFRSLINTAIASGIVLVARCVPYLGVVMSLIGAFMTIFISIVFPACANVKLHHAQMGTAEKVWAVLVIAIGVACAASGTAAALLALQTHRAAGAL